MHFKYLNEMDALLGANHDVEIPVVGTSEGLHICRRNVINVEGTQSPAPSQSSQSLQGGTSRQVEKNRLKLFKELKIKRLKKQIKVAVLKFLRESKAASQRRHEELLNEMRPLQMSFENIIREYLN